jgi:hypothetical protein
MNGLAQCLHARQLTARHARASALRFHFPEAGLIPGSNPRPQDIQKPFVPGALSQTEAGFVRLDGSLAANARRAKKNCRPCPPLALATLRRISCIGLLRQAFEGRSGSPGAGNARRSSLPLGVKGRSSNTTKRFGIMYSGSRLLKLRRRAAASGFCAPRTATT